MLVICNGYLTCNFKDCRCIEPHKPIWESNCFCDDPCNGSCSHNDHSDNIEHENWHILLGGEL